MQSPVGWQPEAPCIRCGTRVAGLPLGERCRDCLRERTRRARRLARRISLLAALLAALYLGWTLPATPNSRVWVGIGTLGSFLLVRLIAMRVAMEYLPE